MACDINLQTIAEANGADSGGTWLINSVGEGSAATELYDCRDCVNSPGSPGATITQPAEITGFSGGIWTVPDDIACGTYSFKYVTVPTPPGYSGGDECADCNDCAIYEVDILEGPEVDTAPDNIEICDEDDPALLKGVNLWGLFDCDQITVANPAPTYNCVDCSGATGRVVKPESCIVKDALDSVSSVWAPVAGTHTRTGVVGTPVGDCPPGVNSQEYNVELSFSPAYADLDLDYNQTSGQYVPERLPVDTPVTICLKITTARAQNAPACDLCEAEVCFTITKVAGDNAGTPTTVEACN